MSPILSTVASAQVRVSFVRVGPVPCSRAHAELQHSCHHLEILKNFILEFVSSNGTVEHACEQRRYAQYSCPLFFAVTFTYSFGNAS